VRTEQITELLCQALENEKGGIQVYTTALKCVVNADLKKEWEESLEQTRNHERIVREVMNKLGLDPDMETPGRLVVRHIGESLVEAMEMSLKDGPAEAAQIVACECVVEAETKDHLNWELIHEVAEKAKGEMRQTSKAAYDEVEEEQDEHLYLVGAALLYVAGLFQHFPSAFAGKATIAQLRPDTQADLDQVHRQPRGRLARIHARREEA
jgi:rubrerythrin